ncbi:tripartite ATP-independent transporter solute receptor, DctP family [Anaerovirgula multivorans]|uniref:Tripartite ATP-independent transporter solute receptor, DctP family n=1 Tax=Anaerovirgula multivorans TaxID=312168 RepID=A0A239HII8_9FIRM|nr:TRAP transporter substrate-binding protein [Anaerovirgula multivorans]SNS80868.1 tripartite ATP-independent transporter solute receptor, DctP family [Anaerovirgula multivorans]
MKNFKRIISLGLVSLLVLLMVACSGGSGTGTETGGNTDGEEKPSFTFSLGMDSPEDTVTYLFAQKFGELLSEKTEGKITVQLYPNGQLGSDREMVESAMSGEIDFVVQTTAPQVNFIPELAVFDMANVFPNVDVARVVLDGPFFNDIAVKYDSAGLKLLGYADQGFRTLTANRKVESLADLRGLKVRTMENPNHLAYWNALGANPTPMAWGEVYIGLQQGIIDAQENPYEVIVSSKMYEQQKYVINTNHILHTLSLISSGNTYSSIPAEYQKAINEAAEEAKIYARQQADARVADRVKIMEDNGVEILDIAPAVLSEMQEKAEAQYELIRSNIGADLVDSLLNASKAAQ